MPSRTLFRTTLLAGFASVAILGCGGGGLSELIAYSLRFTNCVPDLGGLDYYVDDALEISNQAFAASSAYDKASDNARSHFIDVNDAGTSNVLDSIEIDRIHKQSSHVFALGLAAPGNQQPGLRLIAVTVNRKPPTGNNAFIIVVHGFIREVNFPTPNIDLHRTPDSTVITNLPFGNFDVFTVAAGTYDFTVRITGIEDSVLISKPGLAIQGGKVYTMLLQGVEGQGGSIAPDIQLIEEPPDN